MSCELQEIQRFARVFVRRDGVLREVEYVVNRDQRSMIIRAGVSLESVHDVLCTECPLASDGLCPHRACLTKRSRLAV